MNQADANRAKTADGKIESYYDEKIPSLEQLIAQITPENRHEETDWGPEQGREKIEW
jgi:antitoxin component of MazEF toxin-antitoxin module